MADFDVFAEQAEYIEKTNFLKWYTEHPNEKSILTKITSPGAQLISGPRGSGKTTFMKKAYFNLLNKKPSSALPVYVNFKSSLKLEPLYKSNANAIFWFNQWILYKVLIGLFNTIQDFKEQIKFDLSIDKYHAENICSSLELGNISIDKYHAENICSSLELGNISAVSNSDLHLSPEKIQRTIKHVTSQLGKVRCNLYLDDAAHAFSPEQQKDFFDFFRKIKSKNISPKAAIYPGVTTYSPSFHVGHDAQTINIWIQPEDKKYISFMIDILKKRLNKNSLDTLQEKPHILEILCLSSFGIPRSLLNMIRELIEDEKEVKYVASFAYKKIKESFNNTLNIYKTLGIKMPLFENFINNGSIIFDTLTDQIKKYNKTRDASKQIDKFAIVKPVPQEISKILGFLQYSGLIMSRGEISRGEKGVYEVFSIHYGGLIDKNAIICQQSRNASKIALALKNVTANRVTRVSPQTLLDKCSTHAFELSLPPCPKCKTPRINEDAKFCPSCGTPLTTASIFETLIKTDIKHLPITSKMVQNIKSNSNIRTIRDILMDHDHVELLNVPMIGAVRSNRIRQYAEEFIG